MSWRKIAAIKWLTVALFLSLGTLQAAEKTSIAVLDLDVTSGVSESHRRILSDRLRQELFKTGRFTVVERNTMEEVLEEQSLQLAGCTSNECAIEVGRILGVREMVAGSVGQIGTVHSVTVRLIDVETSEVLAAESVDCTCPIEEVLTQQLREVAVKLGRATGGDEPELELQPVSFTREQEPRDRWSIHVPRGSWLDKTFLYIEDMNIHAISTRFGTTFVPGSSMGWFGSLGNGLAVETGMWRGYRPVILFSGGGLGARRDDHRLSYAEGGVGVRLYRFLAGPDAESGLYAGGGGAVTTVTRTVVKGENWVNPTYEGTFGHLSGEVFLGSLFDLHWNLEGRGLFLLFELDYAYLLTASDQPNGFLSLKSGIGIKLDGFSR